MTPCRQELLKCRLLSRVSRILRSEKHLEAMLLVTHLPYIPLDTGEAGCIPCFLGSGVEKINGPLLLNWRVECNVSCEPASMHSIMPCTEGSPPCVLQSICPKFTILLVFSGRPDWNDTSQFPSGPYRASQGVIQRSWWDF